MSYTAEQFFAIAVEHEKKAHEGNFQDRSYALKIRDAAMACSMYMIKQGLTEISYLGPFAGKYGIAGPNSLRLNLGTKYVKIRAGAPIMTSHPSAPRIAGKSHVVKITSASHGYVSEGQIVQPRICWEGSGAYEFSTELSNVEPVEYKTGKILLTEEEAQMLRQTPIAGMVGH